MDVAAASTPTGRVCDKEYCRLGCICESLEKSGSSRSRGPDSSSQREKSPPPSHEVKECSKPECAEKCICQPAAKGTSERWAVCVLALTGFVVLLFQRKGIFRVII